MSININPNNTSVTVTAASNTITVVDAANNVNVSTSQPITSVVTVAIPGPQGAAGAIPSTGSFVVTSSFNSFTGSYNTGSFSGSFIGSLTGTSSWANNATNSSFATTASYFNTSNLATTGSVTFTGNQIITGSARGNVTALTITSNTASMNLSTGNFFTLQLVSGSNTYINPSNILPGQTSILTLSTTGSATVSFPSSVKQPSGSAYVPTTTAGLDIVTLASVDSSTLYVVAVKNLI